MTDTQSRVAPVEHIIDNYSIEMTAKSMESLRGKILATVRVGLPGPASVKTLLRFARRCGVGATASVMAKYGVSITQLLNTAGPSALIDEFLEHLNPSIHGD